MNNIDNPEVSNQNIDQIDYEHIDLQMEDIFNNKGLEMQHTEIEKLKSIFNFSIENNNIHKKVHNELEDLKTSIS